MTKGYGNVRPRFAKYFARKQSSAGAHDGGDHKRPAKDVTDHINEYTDEDHDELKSRWKSSDFFEVGERVEITSGEYANNEGRIVMRRHDKGDATYGVIFDWDMRMHTMYFIGKQLKRVNT